MLVTQVTKKCYICSMLANELRNGNIIKGKCGYSIFDFRNETIVSTLDYYYQPMPLDEEWLVRFGFENKYGFLSLKLLSCIWGEEEACYYIYYGEDKNNEIKIRYLHQLQNLYFALTGEELTLNACDTTES